MPRIAILSTWTGETLVTHTANPNSVKKTLEASVHAGTKLRGADLRGTDLRGADLWGADLEGTILQNATLQGATLQDANLHGAQLGGAILPTGETWERYLAEVVPTLCTAGGHSLATVAAAWQCHEWTNCPMAIAFAVQTLKAIPLLYRPRVQQFIQFFDAGLVPCPLAL
jgi:Pentapeptide repeats (8 copies)